MDTYYGMAQNVSSCPGGALTNLNGIKLVEARG